jgi:hypothetical protein
MTADGDFTSRPVVKSTSAVWTLTAAVRWATAGRLHV